MRAARRLHGAPWAGLMRYRGPDGELRVGQAALVTETGSRAWVRLIARRSETCPPTADWALTKKACERLRWGMPVGGDATRLDSVEANYSVRWLPVDYDWEDLCERHGLTVMPDKVPTATAELCSARFSVIAFVSERAWEEGGWEAIDSENESEQGWVMCLYPR